MSIKNDIVRVRIEVTYGQNVGLLEKRGEERYSEQFSASIGKLIRLSRWEAV